jgi:hypothetical protein
MAGSPPCELAGVPGLPRCSRYMLCNLQPLDKHPHYTDNEGRSKEVYADEEFRITTCADLRPGDVIEARIKGQLYLRGEVTEIMSAHDLFWIREDSLGNRRLLDLNEMEIFIIQAHRLIPNSGP